MPRAARETSSSLRPHPDTPSSHKLLLVLYSRIPASHGYSLCALDFDSFRPSGNDDDDDAVECHRRFPEPILSFGEDGGLPFSMGSFVSGSRLYMVGGGRLGSGGSKETYYIDLKGIPAADPKSLVRRGPDMVIARHPPVVIPVDGMVYVFSLDLLTSSRVQRFDPDAVSWALLPGDLGLRKVHQWQNACMYLIMSYAVHAARIYLSTRAGVFVFHTDSGMWTPPDDGRGGPKYNFLSGCMESSEFYVASDMIPGEVLLYPKLEAFELANPIPGDFDLLAPYEEHVEYKKNHFLLQASRDRFCFVCEGFDAPFDYGFRSSARKHIVVHAFDLLQDVAPAAAVDSLGSPPDQCHQSVTQVLYTMDNDNPLRCGRIADVFLINRNVL